MRKVSHGCTISIIFQKLFNMVPVYVQEIINDIIRYFKKSVPVLQSVGIKSSRVFWIIPFGKIQTSYMDIFSL